MIKNKKGLVFKNVFFAMVVLSVFILAMGDTIVKWNNVYDSEIDYDLYEYSDLNSSKKTADTYSGGVTPDDSDPGTGDFEGKMFRGSYGVIGDILSFRPIKGIYLMIESIETRFSMPYYVSESITLMMIFAFIFAGIAIIFRLTRSTA
ncbi:MAG TPA: hypothetical protein VMV86_04830 [Methanosarcinales archaeon]|nr:hypothetical protein [Methanosarcinales archaeon]